MGTVSIRDLSRNASAVVDDVSASGKPTLVTKHGKPVAAVIPINDADVEDLILAKVPEYAKDLVEAEAELAAGETRPAPDVFADLGV